MAFLTGWRANSADCEHPPGQLARPGKPAGGRRRAAPLRDLRTPRRAGSPDPADRVGMAGLRAEGANPGYRRSPGTEPGTRFTLVGRRRDSPGARRRASRHRRRGRQQASALQRGTERPPLLRDRAASLRHHRLRGSPLVAGAHRVGRRASHSPRVSPLRLSRHQREHPGRPGRPRDSRVAGPGHSSRRRFGRPSRPRPGLDRTAHPSFLYVGRLKRYKGVATAIEALAVARRRSGRM